MSNMMSQTGCVAQVTDRKEETHTIYKGDTIMNQEEQIEIAEHAKSFDESLFAGMKESMIYLGIYDLVELMSELGERDAKNTSRSQFDELYDRFVTQHKVSEKKDHYSEGREDCLLEIESLLYNLDHFIEEKSSRTYNLTHYFKIHEVGEIV